MFLICSTQVSPSVAPPRGEDPAGQIVTRLFMASWISEIIRRRGCPTALWEESWRKAESRSQGLQAGVIGGHSQRRQESFSNPRALKPLPQSSLLIPSLEKWQQRPLCALLQAHASPSPAFLLLAFFSRRDRNKNKWLFRVGGVDEQPSLHRGAFLPLTLSPSNIITHSITHSWSWGRP